MPVSAEPERRAAGFREVGLPFAADAAITRHLAHFLSSHGAVAGADAGQPAKPDAALFNGGFFASPVLRERLLGQIGGWFGGDFTPEVLEHDRLDLAVSRGAAYFGLVRRGRGVRVEAGLARTYYLGAEDGAGGEPRAVCVVPAGTQPGTTVALPDTPVRVRVGRPVELPVFSSGTRLTDPPGSVHEVDETAFAALPPIRTVLKSRGKDGDDLPAVLEAGLTEIGTLDLAVRERAADGSPDGPAVEPVVRRSQHDPHGPLRPRRRRRGRRRDRRRDPRRRRRRAAGRLRGGRDAQAEGRERRARGGRRSLPRRLAADAAPRDVGDAAGPGGGPAEVPRARIPLAEPARLRPPPRLRGGPGRLAGGRNVAAVCTAG